jgi:photosystem II stability/assembly factor-like uncharacterized protein
VSRASFLLISILLAGTAGVGSAADRYDASLFRGLTWRNVGPFRGGRAVTAAGVPGEPRTFYMGATGGGVWKTVDGGLIWSNVTDGFVKTGSVGSIAVAPSDPNVVYVGMGEACVRSTTTSHGDGVYKSTDAGKTWTHLGLDKTRHISKIRIHPTNPDVVYVAAQGNQWADNPERGVYRSRDGGQSWELILKVDDRTGANDLSMDARNPRILYAAMWDHRRKAWQGYQMTSGGPGSALYKTTDGGDHWEELTGKGGLPGDVGKVGVSVSPANPERVYALVEAEEQGIYRSDDAGKTWKRTNRDHVMTERVAYYAHIFADTQDEDTVYVMNAPFLKSVDGGVTFERVRVRHGDNHELWISPVNDQWMIGTNDGGASISYDGGKTWSPEDNQPTAQFYRVITDNLFPYNLYGGQQDNTTVKIPSRGMGPQIDEHDWHPVGGGESAYVAFDPDDPTLVYAGQYQAQITEYDLRTKTARFIMNYPMRTPVYMRQLKDFPIRFNWNAPILVSRHDPKVIYHAGSVLLKSTNRGQSWEEISPDLTRPVPEHMGRVEGPFTTDGIAGAAYHTIFYVAESPHEAGTLYAGTDDGLVHVTRDEGKTWKNVTPEGIGFAQINSIEVSPHEPGTAYIAVSNYKYGDYSPHVFKTRDYGESWTSIIAGIADDAWARVVREDPRRKDLLYLGTETGMYVSFDGGQQWQAFQLDLPVVPVTDLTVHGDDLVASTQGRAFWILDDLSPLRQLDAATAGADQHLFAPAPAHRVEGGGGFFGRSPYGGGENPPNGALVYYSLKKAPEKKISLEILDSSDTVLRTLTSGKGRDALPAAAGLNRFVWDLQRENVAVPDKDLDTYGRSRAYRVAPGAYKVRLTVGDASQTQPLEVLDDPRELHTAEAWDRLERFGAEVYRTTEQLYAAIHAMRGVTRQLKAVTTLAGKGEIADAASALVARAEAWEDKLVQTKTKFPMDPPDAGHQPNRLDFAFIWNMAYADRAGPPLGAGSEKRFADLKKEWEASREEMTRILDGVRELNAKIAQQSMPPVTVPSGGR